MVKKNILFLLIWQTLLLFYYQVNAGELKVTTNNLDENSNYKKVYFAGGCFWCMEESFDREKGIIQSISGYSGGHLKNPTYKEVIYKDTGHVETIEITYDPKMISYKKLLEVFWKNIDPFDKYGQFCDKGKSYRSVIFYKNNSQKKVIQKSIAEIEQIFNSKGLISLKKIIDFD